MPFCSECGSENPDGFAFCGSCGKSSGPVSDSAPEVPGDSTGTPKRRTGLVVVALIAVAAVVVVGAWAALAPVRQNSVRYVIPADAQVYFEADLLALTGDEATAFIESLWDEADREIDLDQDDPISALDEFFDEMAGVTFTDDVSPWIGRHLAAAVFDVEPITLDSDPRGEDVLFNEEVDGAGSLLVAADVREPDLADEFLDDLANGFEREARRNGWDWAMDSTMIGGIRFHEAIGIPEFAGWQAEPLSIYFGRTDDVVLFATSKDLIEEVLDVQSGSSPALASSEGFIEALEESQAGAFLTAYADSRLAEDLFDLDNARNADFTGFDRTARAAKWIAFSASIVQDELLVASQVGFDSDRLPDDASAWLESLDSDDPLGKVLGGSEWYVGFPSLRHACAFFDECGPEEEAIDDYWVAYSAGLNDAEVMMFDSSSDARIVVDNWYDSLEPVGDWQADVSSYQTVILEPDGLTLWVIQARSDLSTEFRSPEDAVEYIETSDRLRDSDNYRTARSALADSATTIFYFDGNRYRRSGSDWIGPIVPETAIGGIIWDGTTLRANATIKIRVARTAGAAPTITTTTAAAAATTTEPSAAVRVGVENAYPPFNFIDGDGIGAGFDYDIWAEICDRIGCTPVFVEAGWPAIIEETGEGVYDVAADGISITAERKTIVDFSDPYMTTIQRLMVRTDENRFGNLQQFQDGDFRLGTQTGTTNHELAASIVDKSRIDAYSQFLLAVLALLSGDVDAVIIDDVAGQGYQGPNAAQTRLLAGDLQSDPLGFLFPRGSQLTLKVNRAIADMKADGTLDDLIKTWFIDFES